MKESLIKDENYINIQGWMSTKLKLAGNELIIFALIYGFAQVENHSYHGNLQYICDWTNISKASCIANLKKLVEKNLIIKKEKEINGIKFCEYFVNFNTIKETLTTIKETLINNKNNNIDLLDNKLSNKSENFEDTVVEDTLDISATISKDIEEKKKAEKKAKKAKELIEIKSILENFTNSKEVKDLLKDYLAVRQKKGLTPAQWKIILEDLRKECGTNKEYAIEKINKAIAGGWLQIIYSNKSSFRSRPSFDNTASHEVPKGVASMTEEEKKDFYENELARDENGNYLQF